MALNNIPAHGADEQKSDLTTAQKARVTQYKDDCEAAFERAIDAFPVRSQIADLTEMFLKDVRTLTDAFSVDMGAPGLGWSAGSVLAYAEVLKAFVDSMYSIASPQADFVNTLKELLQSVETPDELIEKLAKTLPPDVSATMLQRE